MGIIWSRAYYGVRRLPRPRFGELVPYRPGQEVQQRSCISFDMCGGILCNKVLLVYHSYRLASLFCSKCTAFNITVEIATAGLATFQVRRGSLRQ